ncbi:argonaute-like protein [Agrocybe pediades]|nr:argonaute-like protein [Agrocybe pediades]
MIIARSPLLLFDVILPLTGPAQSNRPPRPFNVKITKVRKINPNVLDRYVNGKQSLDEDILSAITALNVIIRMAPNQIYPHNKRSFFTPQERRDIGNGIELWRGIFQSIRPAIGRLILTVDLATAALYKEGPLMRLCLEHIGNPQLRPQNLSPAHGLALQDRLRLQKFVSGLKVTSRTTGDKPRTIRGLSDQGADTIRFTNQTTGTSMTVAHYFASIGMPLQFPSVICVKIGEKALIPLEMCTVMPGQFVKSLPDDKVKARLDFSTMRPDVRLQKVTQGVQNLQHGASNYVQQFGLAIDTTPIKNPARVINGPKLKYGGTGPQAVLEPRAGVWNMMNRKFFKPAAVGAWVILIYEMERRFTDDDVKEAIDSFTKSCGKVGISFRHKDPIVKRENPRGDVTSHIKSIGIACNEKYKEVPSLVVAILPEGAGEIYTVVKHTGDVMLGCATQCLRAMKSRRAKEQYWMNVLLKVNLKLGGINAVADPGSIPLLSDPANSTVVMGADVIHPSPGATDRPSFTALVGCVDYQCAKYVATSRVQKGRQEIINDLQDMCKHILQLRKDYAINVEKKSPQQAAPKRLVFYRDGVSEGQFQHVLDQELPMIQAACAELGYNPKITLIIVGKRHHNQAFPEGRTSDRSGNCDAGTVIDKGITHPTEFDFILLSHAGLLGTSRPAHYNVIFDVSYFVSAVLSNNMIDFRIPEHQQSGFNADSLQSLSYALCHLYGRATRSVSIPAPVYYADIVCSRARNHFDPKGSIGLGSDVGTHTHTSGADGAVLEAFKAAYKPLHPTQEKRMYFMNNQADYLRTYDDTNLNEPTMPNTSVLFRTSEFVGLPYCGASGVGIDVA